MKISEIFESTKYHVVPEDEGEEMIASIVLVDSYGLKAGTGWYVLYGDEGIAALTDNPVHLARLAKVKKKWFGLGPFNSKNRADFESGQIDTGSTKVLYGTYDGKKVFTEETPT